MTNNKKKNDRLLSSLPEKSNNPVTKRLNIRLQGDIAKAWDWMRNQVVREGEKEVTPSDLLKESIQLRKYVLEQQIIQSNNRASYIDDLSAILNLFKPRYPEIDDIRDDMFYYSAADDPC